MLPQTQSLGSILRRIPQFDHLMGLVEQTLLFQILYVESYSKSRLSKYGYRRLNQLFRFKEQDYLRDCPCFNTE